MPTRIDNQVNLFILWFFSSVQLLSHVQLFVTPWITARQASLSITNSQSSLRLSSIESMMPSSHLILCCPLFQLPPIPPSIRETHSSFPLSQLFTSGSQSFEASVSASVLPMNIQSWFPLGLTGWISLKSKGLSRVFSNTTVQRISSVLNFLYSPTLTFIHDYWRNHNYD